MNAVVVLTGSEALTLTDPNPAAWRVELDGVPQPISSVYEVGGEIGLNVMSVAANEATLDFVGGAYVIGAVSGLPLQPVSDFDLEVS